MTQTTEMAPTARRILDIAIIEFSAHGYHRARVRDICRLAGANVAAINYHFGDKQKLYEEALRRAFFSMGGSAPAVAPGTASSVEQRLYAFVFRLLGNLVGDDYSATCGRIIARELVDPSEALEAVVEQGLRPQVDDLLSIVSDALGAESDDRVARRCATGIMGQCLFYFSARPLIERIPLESAHTPANLESLAEHITRFSMSSMHAMRTVACSA